jgi:hypothetical protein
MRAADISQLRQSFRRLIAREDSDYDEARALIMA